MNDYAEILAKDDCLLLLVDLQKTLLDPCFEKDPVTRNAAALIDLAGVFEIPILASVHNPAKLGGFLPELLERIPQPLLYNKLEFSCFENEKVLRAVQETERRTVLLAGLETHVCIFQTGAHALRLGYRVHVVADAVTSRRKVDGELGLGRLKRAGAVISSIEMVLFELVKHAGTPEFRAVLPLLKAL